MELHAAGLLSALAVSVFAGTSAANRTTVGALLAGFAISLATLTTTGVSPQAIATLAVTAAALSLARPQWRCAAPLAAGLFAACWASVLGAQGLPFVPAVAVAAAMTAASIALATRTPGFAPLAVRDEALILVGAFGLVVTVGPNVVAGWQSAAVLAADPRAAAGPSLGSALVALAVGCILAGGVYSLWTRR